MASLFALTASRRCRGHDIYVDEHAIDVHVGRLRKGISLGKPDKMIRTVRGTGYALGDY